MAAQPLLLVASDTSRDCREQKSIKHEIGTVATCRAQDLLAKVDSSHRTPVDGCHPTVPVQGDVPRPRKGLALIRVQQLLVG